MKKSPVIRAGACTLGLSARCLASRSAGAALALVRPSVPNLVVTLLSGGCLWSSSKQNHKGTAYFWECPCVPSLWEIICLLTIWLLFQKRTQHAIKTLASESISRPPGECNPAHLYTYTGSLYTPPTWGSWPSCTTIVFKIRLHDQH